MLGRGLESLIPPKNNNSVSDGSVSNPVIPQGNGNIQQNSVSGFVPPDENKPITEPKDDVRMEEPSIPATPSPIRPSWMDLPELPPEPEFPELPAEPESSELPSVPLEKELPVVEHEPELPAVRDFPELSPKENNPELPVEAELPELPASGPKNVPSEFSKPPGALFETSDHSDDFLSRSRPFRETRDKADIFPQSGGDVKKENYRDVEMEASSKSEDHIFNIEVDKIHPNPHQPRRNFSEDSIHELASSIREFGILQPLVVRKIEKEIDTGTRVEYELIAGERRLMASKYLGLQFVPVIIKRVDEERERLEMAIIENLQRENLSAIEMARAFSRLQDEFRMTQREIAARLGKSREVVANTVRLLDLPQVVQDAIGRGEISESHGRLLLGVPDPAAQEALFRDLVERHLTTRELKYRVESASAASAQSGARRRGRPSLSETPASPELQALESKISSDLGAPVKIVSSVSGESGKITITFYSKEELENLLRRFGEDKL